MMMHYKLLPTRLWRARSVVLLLTIAQLVFWIALIVENSVYLNYGAFYPLVPIFLLVLQGMAALSCRRNLLRLVSTHPCLYACQLLCASASQRFLNNRPPKYQSALLCIVTMAVLCGGLAAVVIFWVMDGTENRKLDDSPGSYAMVFFYPTRNLEHYYISAIATGAFVFAVQMPYALSILMLTFLVGKYVANLPVLLPRLEIRAADMPPASAAAGCVNHEEDFARDDEAALLLQ